MTGLTYSVIGGLDRDRREEDATPPAAGGTTGTSAATAGNDNWVAQTVALRDARSSINVARPANTATGDFLLVSVTAKGLGTTGNICAPNDGTPGRSCARRLRDSRATSVTEATFWSVRGNANAENYAFTFRSGALSGVTGALVAGIPASAVAIRYSGVDPTNPIDVSDGATGSSAAPSAPSVTVNDANDRDRPASSGRARRRSPPSSSPNFSQAGSSTATGASEDASSPAAGAATGTAGATSGSSANWVGQTVALQDARSSITVRAAGEHGDRRLPARVGDR